jgi:RimJ/RimL family protein N-acetyltransferase
MRFQIRKTKVKKQYSKYTRKAKAKISIMSITKLSDTNIKELAEITNDPEVMQNIGSGKKWSIADIKKFISDEKREEAKCNINRDILRNYYSFAILYKNRDGTHIAGFISGRKNKSLIGPPLNSNPFNIILRIFVGKSFQGLGIGKSAVRLFINEYRKILGTNNKSGVFIIADIKKDNIASIKTMLSNQFKYYGDVNYKSQTPDTNASTILNRYVYNL